MCVCLCVCVCVWVRDRDRDRDRDRNRNRERERKCVHKVHAPVWKKKLVQLKKKEAEACVRVYIHTS
jgi:hypothetical protein